jgi:replicative DNA helicase
VHLEHQLRTDGQWAGVGEPGLAQLVQGGAVWEQTADYARLVRDASERRRAVKHMETVAARLREFTEQTDECMAAAIEGLLAMQARGRSCPHQGTKRLAAILVIVASNAEGLHPVYTLFSFLVSLRKRYGGLLFHFYSPCG